MIGSGNTCQDHGVSVGAPIEKPSEALAGPPAAQSYRTFLEGLVRGMRCGILALDRQGEVVLINRVARQVLGLPVESVPGSALPLLLVHHPQLVEMLRDSFSVTSLPNRAELELWPGTPEAKTIGFTVSLVPGPDGEPIGAAVFFKDLTQIEHKEEQERLKDRLAAVGQMAASLAHEIRNPLAAIEITCSLLKRRLAGAERDLLDKIAAEVRRLNATVSTNLEYVRPLVLKLEPAALEPLIEEALLVAEGRCAPAGIQLRRHFAPALAPFLMDRLQLRRVFENLFVNAMEALDGRGTITVSTEVIDVAPDSSVPWAPGAGDCAPRIEQLVVVRIADDGPGIRESDLDRIFHPMFTTKRQGSGIGLAVARKIVNSHQGLIDIASAPGRGAEFSIRLPMALPPEGRSR